MTQNYENTQFLKTLHQKVLQDIKNSFQIVHWEVKTYWISADALRNSTTLFILPGIPAHTELRLSSSTKFWKWSTLLQRETLQGRNCWTLSIMMHYNTERLSSHFCTLVFNTPNFVWSGKVLKVSSNLDQKKLMCIFPKF